MTPVDPNLEKLRTRVQLDPGGRVFAQLAEECRKAGFLDEALRVCRKGLEHHPTYVAALVTLGRTLLDLERVDEARVELEKAVELSPANLIANRALADLYLRMDLHDLALERYRLVRELNPLDASVEELIARCESALPEPEDEETGAFTLVTVTAASAPPVPPPQREEANATARVFPRDAVPAPALLSPEVEITPSDLGVPSAAGAPDSGAAIAASVAVSAEAPSTPPEEPADDASFDELYDSQVVPPAPPAEAATGAAKPAVEEPSMTSETLAELYAKQGLFEKAARMYERLLIQSPDHARWRARVEELRGGAAMPAPPPGPESPPPPPSATAEEKVKLLADIAALRPREESAPRDHRVDTLKQWLHAVERERKRA